MQIPYNESFRRFGKVIDKIFHISTGIRVYFLSIDTNTICSAIRYLVVIQLLYVTSIDTRAVN